MTEDQPSVPVNPDKPARRPVSLLDLGPVALLLITVAGSLGAWHWMLDLTNHFHWYYFAFGAVWLLSVCRQNRRLSQCCLIPVIVWNGTLLLPFYVPVAQPPIPSDGTQVSLISINVHRSNQNKRAVVDYLRGSEADLVIVLEVDVDWVAALQELKDVYPHRKMQPRADNFGIGLLSKWPLKKSWFVELEGTGLPNIGALVERGGNEFQIYGTHPIPPIGAANAKDGRTQLAALGKLASQSAVPCIVAGDFNATPWGVAYQEFATQSGLRDSSLGQGLHGTWNARSWFMRIPIDHVFVPRNATVTRRVTGPDVGSDHFPVEVSVTLPARS